MSNAFAIDNKSYNVYISSNDKVSGTNNNGVYQINWDNFLPRQQQDFKVIFSFQSSAGNYKDVTTTTTVNGISYLNVNSPTLTYSAAKVIMNTQGRSYSFDTSNRGNSNTLGYIQRDVQSSGSSGNTLTAFYMQNAPKTVSRPNQDFITIQINNNWGLGTTPLTDTSPYVGYVFSSLGSIAGYVLQLSTAQPNLTIGTLIGGFGVLAGTTITAINGTQVFQVSMYQIVLAGSTITGSNNYGNPLTDMTSWNMIMEWIPIVNENVIANQRNS